MELNGLSFQVSVPHRAELLKLGCVYKSAGDLDKRQMGRSGVGPTGGTASTFPQVMLRLLVAGHTGSCEWRERTVHIYTLVYSVDPFNISLNNSSNKKSLPRDPCLPRSGPP